MFGDIGNTLKHMELSKSLCRKVRSFGCRSWFEKLWFLPVWLLLGVSRFIIMTVPFRHLSLWLGVHEGINSWVQIADSSSEARAVSISRVVQMTANYTPWKSNCFPQAVTARILLGLYGVPYSLFFGVNRNAEDAILLAHSWVTVGRVRVTGGNGFDQFTVVSCFVCPRLRNVAS